MIKKFLCILFLSVMLAGCSDDPVDAPEQKDPEETVTPEDPEEETPGEETPPEEEDPEPPQEQPEDNRAMEFRVHRLFVETENHAAIKSKEEYVPCSVSIDSDDPDWCFENVEAGIRGRGNSTWLWYPKKPYRIKFDSKQKVLGLGKAKSWVLLANYRDPTDLMNTYVFEMGQALNMPFTNHNRYVWLTLNGEEMGLYQLTEQVQQGSNRVEVDDDEGRLLSLDVDDGPGEAPDAGDNFWSTMYRMPVCVKHPENQTPQQLDNIRGEFSILEQAIKSGTYEEAEALIDMTVLADYLLIQELVYNVELDAPRSMYIHRDKDSKWTMGPLWDFDAGYDFDWGQMYTGHKFFSRYNELVMGKNPYTREGASYDPPRFFTDLFRHEQFRTIYKIEWKKIKSLHENVWAITNEYVTDNRWDAEQDLWPISLLWDGQVTAMKNWLNNRIVFLDSFIPGL